MLLHEKKNFDNLSGPKVFENNKLLTYYQYNRFMVIKTVLDKDLKSTTTKEEFNKLISMKFTDETSSQFDNSIKDACFVYNWMRL